MITPVEPPLTQSEWATACMVWFVMAGASAFTLLAGAWTAVFLFAASLFALVMSRAAKSRRMGSRTG